MPNALRCGHSLTPRAFADVVRTMALAHHKWDAQVGDVAALAPFPLVLPRAAWQSLVSCAESLARETVAMERELAHRPDLFRRLGVPAPLASALGHACLAPTPPAARIMRFDFHPTDDGWTISEVNSDVPGGFTESSRFAALIAERTGDGDVAGDAGATWLDSIAAKLPAGGAVGLLSAPGWVEDTQVVAHLASRLRARGVVAHLAAPPDLRWHDGLAHIANETREVPLDAIVRFYQAEWIATLRCRDAWLPLFAGGRTPVSNPATAALTESKRLPLVWNDLDAPSTTHRRVLPPSFDPRDARGLWDGDWVLKPAYGNTGDDVALRAHASRVDWYPRVLAALAHPHRWVAQRRFRALAVETPRGPLNVCVGVYVVDGHAAGAYARVSASPVIDYAATDAALLVERVNEG